MAIAQPGAASGAAVLQRVTMVTALPDSTLVYLRADYGRQADTAPDNVVATQAKAQPLDHDASAGAESPAASGSALVTSQQPRPARLSNMKDGYGNPQTQDQGGLSSHLRPEEQYAQTQRILTAAPHAMQLDVHA
jgi:hypothetical protein